MALETCRAERDFACTAEPADGDRRGAGAPRGGRW